MLRMVHLFENVQMIFKLVRHMASQQWQVNENSFLPALIDVDSLLKADVLMCIVLSSPHFYRRLKRQFYQTQLLCIVSNTVECSLLKLIVYCLVLCLEIVTDISFTRRFWICFFKQQISELQIFNLLKKNFCLFKRNKMRHMREAKKKKTKKHRFFFVFFFCDYGECNFQLTSATM